MSLHAARDIIGCFDTLKNLGIQPALSTKNVTTVAVKQGMDNCTISYTECLRSS